ncbi:hypothetical protein BOTBODRAFT_35545 [Botryobasidium botryosum FD-172 SS1]|uniref:Carbonic anhydrase n=1 Tax=Botryobasidium botryosum (strain FD-172 SS1) TaxID=930990 RepID=A0A067M6Q5_BOTB1|nr:hypothetical protein BOTBODRAFT_35545 [Botryobasidium botryosum FD-172 SS1]
MLRGLINVRRGCKPHLDAFRVITAPTRTSINSDIHIRHRAVHTRKPPSQPRVITPPSYHLSFQPYQVTPRAETHEIVDTLLKSNEIWAASVAQKDPNFFKKSAAEDQTPKILWLGCSDSRVPESVLLSAKPGDIFVHRNVGNQFRTEDVSTQAVLDFSINFIKIEHIFIVGHTQCGACRASISGAPPGPIANFLTQLVRLAEAPHITELPEPEAVQRLIEDNIRQQVTNVINSKIVRDAWDRGQKLHVHGLLYRLETGRLEDMNMTFP